MRVLILQDKNLRY